jgi:hypothetical protein
VTLHPQPLVLASQPGNFGDQVRRRAGRRLRYGAPPRPPRLHRELLHPPQDRAGSSPDLRYPRRCPTRFAPIYRGLLQFPPPALGSGLSQPSSCRAIGCLNPSTLSGDLNLESKRGIEVSVRGAPSLSLMHPIPSYGDLVVQHLNHPFQHAPVSPPWDTAVLRDDVSERLIQRSPIPKHSVDKLVHIAPSSIGHRTTLALCLHRGELGCLSSIKVKEVLTAMISRLPHLPEITGAIGPNTRQEVWLDWLYRACGKRDEMPAPRQLPS